MKPTPTEEGEERNLRGAPRPVPTIEHPRPARKRKFHWGWVVIILGAAGLACTYWYTHRPSALGGPGAHGGGFHRFAFGGGFGMSMPVVAVPAKVMPLDIYLNGLGTVTPLATVTVRSQISGELMQVDFQEGQEVKKGQLLAIIDPRPYEVAEQQAQGQLLQAQAQLEQAKSDLSRYEALLKQDSIAQQQVDDEKALVNQYSGLVEADKASIANAQLNLTYCHITAPVSGRVGLRQVDPGNYVTPADANGIVVLTQIRPISVIFTLPEEDVGEVMQRLASGAKIPVYAYDPTMTNRIATGSLATMDNEVDTTTGTVRLRADFANADEALFPNEFVNARMLIDVDRTALVVPASSIERGQDGAFVYVVQPDDTVTAQPVTLGQAEGENQSVAKGLTAGQLVVSDGADKLRDGMQVTVQQPGAPASAAPAAGNGAAAGSHHRKGNWAGKGKGDWQKRREQGGGS